MEPFTAISEFVAPECMAAATNPDRPLMNSNLTRTSLSLCGSSAMVSAPGMHPNIFMELSRTLGCATMRRGSEDAISLALIGLREGFQIARRTSVNPSRVVHGLIQADQSKNELRSLHSSRSSGAIIPAMTAATTVSNTKIKALTDQLGMYSLSMGGLRPVAGFCPSVLRVSC